MAGPISLHTQTNGSRGSGTTGDPADITVFVYDVTTDEDTHSVLLTAVLSAVVFSGEGADAVQFYRIGVNSDLSFEGLGAPVGPIYTLSGIDGTASYCTLVMAVDPDPPETGAYGLGLLTVDNVATFTVPFMTAFTF